MHDILSTNNSHAEVTSKDIDLTLKLMSQHLQKEIMRNEPIASKTVHLCEASKYFEQFEREDDAKFTNR